MTRRIRRSSIDALLERINLIDVVSQSVQLRRSGSRSMGKCPFHEDSSPSFLVDERHYHCFGCKAHGNVIDFEMNRAGSGFLEAVESLANKSNFVLEYEENGRESEQERAQSDERRSLSYIMTEVTRAYAKYLWTKDGTQALQYLRSRGFSDEHIRDWELGLAPHNNVLKKMAGNRGWSLAQLETAGLLKKRVSEDEWYDFFRDRVVIPIRDEKGNPIALGGRIFLPVASGRNPPPKYLNSPETPLFQKAKTLFNLHRARTAIVQCGYAIVVEGYMDCLALARSGVINVVAVLGTALTAEHLRKLARLTKRVVICFDSDNAGREAAKRTFETGFPLNVVELQYASVPSGKDPDDYVRQFGAEAFKTVVERAIPLSGWVCDHLLAQCNTREAQVRKIKTEFVPIILKNPDAAVREIALQSTALVLGLSSIASLTSGVGGTPNRGIGGPGFNGGPRTHNETSENEPLSEAVRTDAKSADVAARHLNDSFGLSSAEEANFLFAFAYARFSMLPERLRNVLQGQQSDCPMDEIVLAQMLSAGLSPNVSQAVLAWSEVLLQKQSDEAALVDCRTSEVPETAMLPQIRALASLNPEELLDSGLERWVRGVLEPPVGAFAKPQLNKSEDLLDPSNLPYVRMVIRDVGVSRSKNVLPTLLGRLLAQLEVSYLDSQIDSTNRELKRIDALGERDSEERELQSQRLRKLATERLRRFQKFLQRGQL